MPLTAFIEATDI